MHVGVCTIAFEVHASDSLKAKRQVVRSIKDRVRHRFNVSIAEVGDLDSHTDAELGIAYVSNDVRHLNSVMDKIVNYIEDEFPISVSGVDMELL
ncbi:DUF503 domain-containing protein [Candidatus Poribacteria bacterium]|nr:DUF503 domain-containing protein [Candidatus Poribacteria bacterium]